jgi:hypothetical protein
MKQTIHLLLFAIALHFNCQAIQPKTSAAFHTILVQIRMDDFFSVRDNYAANRKQLSRNERLFTEAFLDNAFNRLKESEQKTVRLLNTKNTFADTLQLALLELQEDNLVKLFRYGEAAELTKNILHNFGDQLNEKDRADYENNLKLWSALASVPPQTVQLHAGSQLMVKDKAGLNTLQVSANNQTMPFIFDTGANFSTVPESTARQLGMRRLEGSIELGAITGGTTQAQLAVADTFLLGDIVFRNVIFLVIPDENLSFPSIDYRIYGIIGYPVIAALNEIRIGQDGTFTIPEQQTAFTSASNMAMKQLIPIIRIDNRHYTFDSGANQTILYSAYYQSEKARIDSLYQPEVISFGGAAGSDTFEGFYAEVSFHVSGKTILLHQTPVLKTPIKDDETVFGNIGQDVIQQFPLMILNFDQMHLEFR